MNIPYVIDNLQHKLADVLNDILAQHQGKSMDVATAYFSIHGFGLIKENIQGLGSFRLLLGFEPKTGEDIGMHPDPSAFRVSLKDDLNREPFTIETLELVEDLIRFLRRDDVDVRLYTKGFLHAKCYLFYADRPSAGWDRFQPVAGIVGSSNFTAPGLVSNRELNLAHKAVLSEDEAVDDLDRVEADIPFEDRQRLKGAVGARAIAELDRWFEAQWNDSNDYKEELIELLNESKFGEKEYTPYEIYMKSLYEYFKDDLAAGTERPYTRTAVELTEFQEDAVRKARAILGRYDGVMIADSVGLGKTWIGKRLLEDYAYHLRHKALVVCPAQLREMWNRELTGANIAAHYLTQEAMGRGDFDPQHLADVDVILVDESHNFRNSGTQRYGALEDLISRNNGRGASGDRKKIILLTATPVNNDLLDLYHQINLFARNDPAYFAAVGIGNLRRYFHAARRRNGGEPVNVFNLLEEVVIRRTRQFIKDAYPEATIDGEPVRFPDRTLVTERYNLEKTYEGIYDQVVQGIESLKLAPFHLEEYKKDRKAIDPFEEGRQAALVGIFKTLYLKRFESSVVALRISLRRALEYLKTFESYLLDGKLLRSDDLRKLRRFIEDDEEEDDVTPTSLADEIDASEQAKQYIDENLVEVDRDDYHLRRLHDDLQKDIETLTTLFNNVNHITPDKDLKLQLLKELLREKLKGQKVIVFSYFRDTARYVFQQLREDKAFLEDLGHPNLRRLDGGARPKERTHIIEAFAPRANKRSDLEGTEREIDVLISTDVISEGQNLQDCAHLVNYDLHWNPTRMVQRAGRIDRIGAKFDNLYIRNVFPDEGLERLLGIVERLQDKIETIDRTGMLDTSILGETVHPRTFNTLRRIAEEDGSVIEEEEAISELATHENMLRQLSELINREGQEWLDRLPDGIHSGLVKPGARGVFFYFQAERKERPGRYHFWKYIDLHRNEILDNRMLITNLIACQPDTKRVVSMTREEVFPLMESVIQDILAGQEAQIGLEAAPRLVDPLQTTVSTLLKGWLHHPDFNRTDLITLIKFLGQPLVGRHLKTLRDAYKEFQKSQDPATLLSTCLMLYETVGTASQSEEAEKWTTTPLRREDLRLICYDVLSG